MENYTIYERETNTGNVLILLKLIYKNNANIKNPNRIIVRSYSKTEIKDQWLRIAKKILQIKKRTWGKTGMWEEMLSLYDSSRFNMHSE